MSAVPHRLIAALAGVLVVLIGVVALFVTAYHDPKPNGLEVAVVAHPIAEQRLEQRLNASSPGAIELTRAASPDAARAAVRDGDVAGAFIADPAQPTLVVANAGSFMVAGALEQAFTRVARASGGAPLIVEDVRSLPPGDSRGLTMVFLAFGAAVPSFVLGVLLWALGGGVRPRTLTGLLGACAALAGLLSAATVGAVSASLEGAFWEVAGLVALLTFAVGAAVSGLGRMLGPAGIGLGALVLVLLAQSSSGGPIGPAMLPDAYQALGRLLPTGAAIAGLRDAVYFGGAHMAGPVTVLVAWAVAGTAGVAIGRRCPNGQAGVVQY